MSNKNIFFVTAFFITFLFNFSLSYGQFFCGDTDGGINIYSKSTCRTNFGSWTDYCVSSNSVYEYYCWLTIPPQCAGGAYSCPSGYYCYDGRCTNVATTTTTTSQPQCENKNYKCVDKDSYNYEVWCDGKLNQTITKYCGSDEKCEIGQCVEKAIKLICDKTCDAGSKCRCEIEGICITGFWSLENHNVAPTIADIPPTTLDFVANDIGKVNVTAICSDPKERDTETVTIQESMLQCQSECKVSEECKCSIIGCSSGTLVLSNKIKNPLKEPLLFEIKYTPYKTSFVGLDNGTAEAFFICTDPSKSSRRDIAIIGSPIITTTTTTQITITTTTTTIQTTGKFVPEQFLCLKITDGYQCSLSYDNGLGEDMILLSIVSDKEGKIVKTVTSTMSRGYSVISQKISCKAISAGDYYVSWKAYKSSDTTYPASWSTSSEVQKIQCR